MSGPVLTLRAWLLLAFGWVLSLPLLTLLLSGALGQDLVAQTRWDLQHQATLLALYVQAEAPDGDLPRHGRRLSAGLRRAKAATLSGIRLVDAGGVVVASSSDGPVLNEDLSGEPEVRAALAGARGATAVRPREPHRDAPLASPSRRAAVRVFVSHPVVVDGAVVGALVLSRTPREELQALYQMAPAGLLHGALIALGLTVAFALAASAVLTRSLATVDRAASAIAEGRFEAIDALAPARASRVAEVGRAARAVEVMAARLKRRLSYISEFASNVSHEFKTPLATLKGTLELLEDDPGMPEEQRERMIRNASSSVERLERLVTGLLALARADERREDAPIALDELLDEVARRHGVPRSGAAGDVHGDRAQLDAVIHNLLDNARVHGGRARLEAFTEGGRIGFRVVDDGPGISAANLPRVFDRFFTTGREGGSTGLGLALVRAIVEAHGGEVTVDSVPGQTRFTVTLPAARGRAGG